MKERPIRVGIFILTACVLFANITGCSRTQAKSVEPEYRTEATIKDIMDSVVDPNADYLWDSVSTLSNAKGMVVRAPNSDSDWLEERRHVIALMEATNLIQMPGRRVARPGEKAENPNIEETPEQIQSLIDSDRASFIKYAHGLYDAAALMLKAVESKNVEGISKAGEDVDQACEHCHEHYWYPHQYDNLPKSSGDSGEHVVNPIPKPGVPEL